MPGGEGIGDPPPVTEIDASTASAFRLGGGDVVPPCAPDSVDSGDFLRVSCVPC